VEVIQVEVIAIEVTGITIAVPDTQALTHNRIEEVSSREIPPT
jgi:hypothetical protein